MATLVCVTKDINKTREFCFTDCGPSDGCNPDDEFNPEENLKKKNV